MNFRPGVWVCIVAVFCGLLPLSGQEARGTLLGRVTDPSNAVIVGAKVDALNTETGVHFASTTNGAGDYIIPFLIPGPYTIAVESSGFKSYTRSGVQVRVNDQVSVNIQMEIGQATQSVQVTTEAPMLDTSTASMGQVVDSRTIMDLPLKDGMVLVMATFAPGVTFTPESAGYVRPFDTSSPSTMSIDGTRSGSNQFMMDGAPNMQGTQVAYSPPPGVVDEFKVQGVDVRRRQRFHGGRGHQHEPEVGRQRSPRPDLLLHAEPGGQRGQVLPAESWETAIPVVPLGRQRERARRHPEALRRPQQDLLHVRL